MTESVKLVHNIYKVFASFLSDDGQVFSLSPTLPLLMDHLDPVMHLLRNFHITYGVIRKCKNKYAQ